MIPAFVEVAASSKRGEMKINIKKFIIYAVPVIVVAGTIIVLMLIFKPSLYYQTASTRRMAERLEEIAQSVDPRANPYVNSERVKSLRELVDNLGESGSSPNHPRQIQILEARLTLATELLLDGRTEEALQQFQHLQALSEEYKFLNLYFRQKLQTLRAVAYLRLGEQENCIMQHNIDACLFPIRDSGVHQIERGSRAAIEEYLTILDENPVDLTSWWLLNIAYMTLGVYPEKVPQAYLIPPRIFESDYNIKRFYDVAPRLGLDVVGLAGGSIMEDFDGDGYLDIMASSWGLRDQLRYFRNNGDGTFTDRTEEAGLMGIVGGLNLCHADYNNDGFADVLVLRGAWLSMPPATDGGRHPNSLLRNRGDGSFDDVTEEAGLLTLHPTQTAAWGDYDNDGWVDLFIGNETYGELHACELFRNNGDATFTDVAKEAGVTAVGYIKGVVWGDYNNDGLLDLYISRLLDPNLLYRNDGKDASGQWKFTKVTNETGVAEPVCSFPTWFWDYDNDGWLDIFVSGYCAGAGDVAADYLGFPSDADYSGFYPDFMGLPPDTKHPRLYRNNHDGTFTDVTQAAKLDKVLLTMGCNFGDLDNDGYLDFYVGTGDPDFRSLMPNRMFRNAEGKRFQDVTTSGGFGHLQKGHGVAFGDIDHDGDQDIYAVIGGAFAGDIFQNVLFENPGHGNHWITLRLEGVQSNRAAIGARIKVRVNTENSSRDIYATVTTGGSFGASSLQQEIGLGQATSIRAIEIIWPATGEVQVFKDIEMDQILKIREGDPVPVPVPSKPFDLSPDDRPGEHAHVHHEH